MGKEMEFLEQTRGKSKKDPDLYCTTIAVQHVYIVYIMTIHNQDAHNSFVTQNCVSEHCGL